MAPKELWQMMDTETFYLLWERFAVSTLTTVLPDDIEAECRNLGISLMYYIEEFI